MTLPLVAGHDERDLDCIPAVKLKSAFDCLAGSRLRRYTCHSAGLDIASLGPRCFGGGKLEGDRIVRLVFLDEAGTSNPEHEPYLVVAAVIVDADKKLIAVQAHLDSLVL